MKWLAHRWWKKLSSCQFLDNAKNNIIPKILHWLFPQGGTPWGSFTPWKLLPLPEIWSENNSITIDFAPLKKFPEESQLHVGKFSCRNKIWSCTILGCYSTMWIKDFSPHCTINTLNVILWSRTKKQIFSYKICMPFIWILLIKGRFTNQFFSRETSCGCFFDTPSPPSKKRCQWPKSLKINFF